MAQRSSVTTLPEPIAYLNGRWLPFSQAAVSATDAGFVLGVTVSEQLRTFGGRLFRLDRHLARLARSLEIVGVNPGLRLKDLEQIATELAAHNHSLLDPADDLGLTIFVTPGPYGAFAAGAPRQGPTVCIHTQPLPFRQWAAKYETGDSLIVTDVRQVPAECWPLELKCRSRMHYYLADRQAQLAEPGARALMLDERGLVTEASTANILAYCKDVGLISPPRERILPGISVSMVELLAEEIGTPLVHRDLTVADAAAADELLLCSTSPCLWSVTRLNQRPIGNGQPGPLAQRLRDAWSARVGVQIEAQARQFAGRA
ncbi:MAG: aminotransferase class IV [Pirellulaceae bacterium]